MPHRSGIDRLVTRLAAWAVGVFQHVECRGGPVPDGPVLITANHPNSLLDPLIVFRASQRPARPLAKAPLFEQAILGTVLRALGGLPVYRRQDDPSIMHRNDRTFSAAVDALRAGDAVQIFPEGRSHSEPAIVELRTGAARIAIAAEVASDWTLGLRIVPIGITYHRKSLFRGTALAVIGEPFTILDYRDASDADPSDSVRRLTAEITEHIQQVTLNLASHDDAELIETADRLYTRGKGLRRWREREGMADRLPRLQRFAQAVAWLRLHEPDRHDRLARAVRRYRRALDAFGAAEADVPPGYDTHNVLRYITRQTVALTLGLPLAVVGSILWAPAYRVPGLTVRMIRPEFEAIATYKLATGFFAVPVTIAVITVLAGWLGGPVVGLLAGIATILCGFATIRWRERWNRVREDARVFVRVLRNPRGVDRLAALRTSLVDQFDDVLDDMERDDPDSTPLPTRSTG